MTSIFGKLPIQSQTKLLATLATVTPTQTIQSTVCQVLDTLFYVMVIFKSYPNSLQDIQFFMQNHWKV